MCMLLYFCRSVQTELVSVVSNKSGNDLETAKMFENKHKVLDNFQSAASTWSTAGLNRQVCLTIILFNMG